MFIERFLGHEKRKTSLLTWIWRHMCVRPLIDHGQQPMKMHTEVTLLYKYYLRTVFKYCLINEQECFIRYNYKDTRR